MSGCKLNIIIESIHLENKSIRTNTNLSVLTENEYINASELKDQITQLLTDVIKYFDENGEWPTVSIETDEVEEDDSTS